MIPPRPPLVEAATRPFAGDAEMHLAATSLLESHLHQHPAADTALQRWEHLDHRKRRTHRLRYLWTVAALFSAVVLLSEIPGIRQFSQWSSWSFHFNLFDPEPMPGSKAYLERAYHRGSAQDRLLLFGDLSIANEVERTEALWRSDPGNPIFFAGYSMQHLFHHKSLPPDFLEDARRMDPHNSWFIYLAASQEAQECVKPDPRKSRRVAGKTVYDTPKTWSVVDQKRYEACLTLFKQAAELPDFRTYMAPYLAARARVLPQEGPLDSIDASLAYDLRSRVMPLRQVADVIATESSRLAAAKDTEGFRAHVSLAGRFLDALSSESNGILVDEMLFGVVIMTLAEGIEDGATILGLAPEAERWGRIRRLTTERKDLRSSAKFIVDGKAVDPGQHVGLVLHESLPVLARQVSNPPHLTDADLHPARWFDHDIFSMLYAKLLGLLVFPCALALYSHRFLISPLSRLLSIRMDELLKTSDHVWIAGVGVWLPFLLVMGVNRCTPLGARDLALTGIGFLMPLGHFIALMLLWLTVPVVLARWCLARRAGCFGFAGPSWGDVLAVSAAIAFVPLVGYAALTRSAPERWLAWMEAIGASAAGVADPTFFWIALGCVAIVAIWLLWNLGVAMTGRQDRQFHGATLSRSIADVPPSLLLCLALSIPLFQKMGELSFQQETLMKLDPAEPGWTRYEYRVSNQAHRELLEILQSQP